MVYYETGVSTSTAIKYLSQFLKNSQQMAAEILKETFLG